MIYAVLEGKNLEIEDILSSREEAERYLQTFYVADDDVVVISARDKESLYKEISRRLSPTGGKKILITEKTYICTVYFIANLDDWVGDKEY